MISTRRELEMNDAFTGHALHDRGLVDRGNRILATSASSITPLADPLCFSVGCRIYPITGLISFGIDEVLPVMPPVYVILFLEVQPVLFAVRKTQDAVVETSLLARTSIGRPA